MAVIYDEFCGNCMIKYEMTDMRNHYKDCVPFCGNRGRFNYSFEITVVLVHRLQIFLFFIVYLLPTLCSFQASFIIHRHGIKKQIQSNNREHSSTMSYNLYRNRVLQRSSSGELELPRHLLSRNISIPRDRYSLCDSILFATCWCPTYFIDISSPYISKWFFEHVIVTWLTYTARVLIMFYFAFAPFGVRVD